MRFNRITLLSALGAFMILQSRGNGASGVQEDDAAVEKILDRVNTVYAAMKSYQDSGSVKEVFIDGGGNEIHEKPFKTAFVRPERFRFEYSYQRPGSDKRGRHIVWCNGKDVRTWWDVQPGEKKEESLGMAVAGATGVSSGAAYFIPALLLFEEIGGRRITEMKGAKRMPDAPLEKQDCFLVQANQGKGSTTLWIDKKSFLVRRIDEKRNFGAFQTESTTVYNPMADAAVADDLLEFNAPKK